MNANELAPFGYTKSGRVRKTALKPKIALYGYTKSGRIRVKPLKSQIYNICEDCGIKFDNEGWLKLKYCECCDDQRRSDEEQDHEPDVDDRDAPNILPYKKCGFCNERSSCGNYTDEDVWKCEDCTPDQENYLSELIECIKCERDVRRVDMAWTKTGSGYTDVCEECDKECICESNEKPNSLCIQHMCCFICSNQHSLIHLNQGTALWLCRECDDKGIWCRGCRNIIDEESGFCSTGCEYEGGISGGNVHDK